MPPPAAADACTEATIAGAGADRRNTSKLRRYCPWRSAVFTMDQRYVRVSSGYLGLNSFFLADLLRF